MYSNGNSIFTNYCFIESFDSIFSTLLFQELDVAETSAFTVSKDLEFARSNLSVFLEQFHETLLINVFWQVPNYDVSLAVKVLFLLFIEDNLFSVNGLVIHLFHASLGLLFFNEIEVSETE